VFVIGYVVANQIGYLVVQWLANAQVGAFSAYQWAFTFFMLPHGLFAVSIITALLPSMSQHAVDKNWDELRERVSTGMRTTFLLILPAAVGYFVLGEPVVRVLLEHGIMTAKSTRLVADVLRFFVLGLVPFSLFQLLLRAFYALQDTRTPFMVNGAAVVVNLMINVPMFAIMGVQGLAVGHALAYVVGSTLLGRALARRIGGLDGARVARSAARISVAGLLMGIVVWLTSRGVESFLDVSVLAGQITAVAIPVGVGAIAYLLFARMFRVEELDYVRSLLGRRLGR
jgi:putative peptidoglycan lipid II flippase